MAYDTLETEDHGAVRRILLARPAQRNAQSQQMLDELMPAMDAGGMETFVMNVYRAVDRSQVQFYFLYHYDKPCFYDAEIEALGGHITKLTVRQDNNIPKYLHDLRAFFTAHPEYKVIHGH